MNNLMSNFSGLEMSRMEMKKVKGGQCYYKNSGSGGGNSTCANASDCAGAVSDGWGSNYCCSSCGTATWCSGGRCPQL
jgi:hypothetical protein